jgi:vesicle-associated membrane protein-associated protein A
MKLTYEAGDSMALSPGTALAFKIKTTKPKRYIVKPNQGIIPANSSESISIIVVETERQILMDEWVSSGIADTTNKFLVQCVPVDASFVEIVQGESSKEKLEKVTSRF